MITRAHEVFSPMFDKYDELNNSVQENVSAIRVVKAFVREDYEKKRFARANEGLYRHGVRAERIVS